MINFLVVTVHWTRSFGCLCGKNVIRFEPTLKGNNFRGNKMPELTDQQLKDRVQKLENLLRVKNASTSYTSPHNLHNLLYSIVCYNYAKLKPCLQAREERIVALETENAMLYLKLAQVNYMQ